MTFTMTEPDMPAGQPGGRYHLVIAGALDLAAAPTTRERVARILSAPAVRELVIDLAAVDFLDAAGVGALVGCYHAAERAGTTLRVTAANGLPRRILDLTGVADLLATPLPPVRQG